MRNFKTVIIYIALFSLTSCGMLGDDDPDGSASASAAKLTESEYDALSNEEKYIVVNKLQATLYKGEAVADFFDIGNGTTSLSLKSGGNTPTRVEASLSQPLVDKDSHYRRIDDNYLFDTSSDYSGFKTQQYPSAVLFELPLSKDYFEFWIAYQLANTILFSPAVELESVDYVDVQHVLYRLIQMLDEERSIREIVYEHMLSQENWRRFRSPEDNTREMMEIFLERFIDEEVPMAAMACQNWYLTDGGRDYQLVIDYNENTAPQNILDTSVTTCYDFYREVSEHASLLPRIISVLVNVFFSDHTDAEKNQLVNDIVASKPTTFQQIFSTIIFSREYLLNTERIKQFEETFFNIAHRIDWFAHRNYFRYLNRRPDRTSFETLGDMKQEAMAYKLGRTAEVPVDSLSFAFTHKSIREHLLIDMKRDEFNVDDGGWQADFINVGLDGDDFIHYLFLSVISRKASNNELSVLNDIIENQRYDGTDMDDKQKQASIVLDYLSRLSELYHFSSVNQAEERS